MSTLFPSYAEVALPVPVPRTFTYALPAGLREWAVPGVRVLAPFGNQTLEGVLVDLVDEAEVEASRIKPLADVLDREPFFSAELLDVCRWVAEYYLCSWGEALHAAIPAGVRVISRRRVRRTARATPDAAEELRAQAPLQAAILDALASEGGRTVSQLRATFPRSAIYAPLAALEAKGLIEIDAEQVTRAGPRRVLGVRLAQSPHETSAGLPALRRRAPKQAALIERLCRADGALPVAEIVRETGTNYGTVRALESKRLVLVEEIEEMRSVLDEETQGLAFSTQPLLLEGAQEEAFGAILDALQASRHETFVLYGVTGSGKTEVYMQAIRHVLREGKGALVLVPEIALTPQTVRRFVARFGPCVAVLHSRLSAGERYDEWRRIRRGEASIVVGPRSAIFAPLRRLGLIVLDEEHETTYKQEEPAPRYHARDVAEYRARLAGIPLVLGSATPSLESIHRAQRGDYRLLRIPQRVQNIALPPVHLCDMRRELQRGNMTIFAERLHAGIEDRLARGEQVILFLNRRGFSTYVFCRDCGYVERCPRCHISLTYHRRQELLICHHCGYVQAPSELCPTCGSRRIKFLGLGTQQVEEEVRRRFPDARVARMDADTTAGKGAHRSILNAFREGAIDVLVGTQMIAKGLDFPNVTLVGVILAETALYLPDFRAGERAFNLLTQVAGRAGRSARGGEVVFQTYQPEHASIIAAQHHDYDAFSVRELAEREAYGYPPFTHALRFLLRGEEERDVIASAQALKDALDELCAESEPFGHVIVKGPVPAPFSRVRGQFRWHLLLCAEEPRVLQQIARALLDRASGFPARGDVSIVPDMDPISLL